LAFIFSHRLIDFFIRKLKDFLIISVTFLKYVPYNDNSISNWLSYAKRWEKNLSKDANIAKINVKFWAKTCDRDSKKSLEIFKMCLSWTKNILWSWNTICSMCRRAQDIQMSLKNTLSKEHSPKESAIQTRFKNQTKLLRVVPSVFLYFWHNFQN